MNKYNQVPNQYFINLFKEYNSKEQFNILQLGCNAGRNLEAIAKQFPKAMYWGIDIDQDIITQARINFSKIEAKGHFICKDIQKMNFHESLIQLPKFDYILCPDVLEHLTNPKEVLEYIQQFLTEDGIVLASIPNLMHYAVIKPLIQEGKFHYIDTGLLDSDHKHLFTLNEIYQMFDQAGYFVQNLYQIFLDKEEEWDMDFIHKLVALKSQGSNVTEKNYTAFSYYVVAIKKN